MRELGVIRTGGAVVATTYAPDGRLLVASSNGSAAVYKPDGTRLVAVPGGVPLTRAAWSPDGASFTTGDSAGTVTIRRARDGRVVARVHTPAPISALDYAGGELLAASGAHVRLLSHGGRADPHDLRPGRCCRRGPEPRRPVARRRGQAPWGGHDARARCEDRARPEGAARARDRLDRLQLGRASARDGKHRQDSPSLGAAGGQARPRPPERRSCPRGGVLARRHVARHLELRRRGVAVGRCDRCPHAAARRRDRRRKRRSVQPGRKAGRRRVRRPPCADLQHPGRPPPRPARRARRPGDRGRVRPVGPRDRHRLDRRHGPSLELVSRRRPRADRQAERARGRAL